MAKVKSMQYMLLKLIQTTLLAALAEKFSTPFDAMFSNFIKELRHLSKNGRLLPGHDTFYAELFSVAYQLMTKRSEADMDMYRSLLQKDRIKFFALVIKHYEEKTNSTDESCSIDFESQLLSTHFTKNRVHFADKPIHKPVEKPGTDPKPRTESKPKPAADQTKPASKKAQLPSEFFVVVMPPLSLKKTTYALLAANFNITEQPKIDLATLRFSASHKRNIVIVYSFEGLPVSIPGVTYYIFGLRDSTKPDDIAKNFYLQEEYHVPAKAKLSATFIRREVETLLKGLKVVAPKLGSDIVLKSDEDLIQTLNVNRAGSTPVQPVVEQTEEIKSDRKANQAKAKQAPV